MSGDLTNDELVAGYITYQRLRGFSEATVTRRAWTLGDLRAHTGDRPLLELDRDTIEAWMAKFPTATTRAAMLSDVRQMFRWAINRDLLDVDPTARTDRPRIPTRAATPLTRGDLARLIDEAPTWGLRMIFLLGAYGGLRAGEVAALRYDDVRLDEGVLVVRQGKGGKDRVVPLAHRIAVELDPNGRGKVVHYKTANTVSHAARDHYRRCGVAGRFHDLRHSFATEAGRVSGGNVVLVAQLLGHSSIQTTQRYIGWTPAGDDVVQAMHAGGCRDAS